MLDFRNCIIWWPIFQIGIWNIYSRKFDFMFLVTVCLKQKTHSQNIFIFFLNWCFVLLLQILQIHSLFNCTLKLCLHCFSFHSYYLLWKLVRTQKTICIHATICKTLAKLLDYFTYQCHLVDKSGNCEFILMEKNWT